MTNKVFLSASTIIVITLSLFLTLPNLGKPFYGHHEFNGVFYSQIARNYLRLGVIKTKLLQVTTTADVPQAQWGTHTHHPATYPLLLALAYKMGGEYESVARLLSILATVISIGLFAVIGKKITGKSTAVLMLLPLVLTPLWRYYTRMPVFEPLLLPLTLWLYLAYTEQKSHQVAVSAFLLAILDWPGYWPAIGLILYELVTHRRLTKMVLMSALGLAVGTGLILGAQWVSTGNSLTDFIAVGTYRLNMAPYTVMEWVRLLMARSKAFFGLPVIVLAILGIISARKNKALRPLLFISLFAGIAHIIVFRNITWYHDYMLYHLIPFMGITAMSLWNASKRSYVIMGIVMVVTWITTNPFYSALAGMEPHKDCYTMGRQANNQSVPLEFTLSQEKVAECGPFVNYYADKKVTLREE